MNHVFLTQSAHTELIALAVIKNRQLDNSRCHLICLRDYQPYSKINATKLPVNWRGKYFRALRFSTFKERHKNLSDFLDITTNNEEFCVYIPQLSETFVPLIITHHNCRYFNHIEEGLHSSIYKIDQSIRQGFASRLEEFVKHIIFKYMLKKISVKPKNLPRPCFTSSRAREFFHVSDYAYKEIDQKFKTRVNLNDGIYILNEKIPASAKYMVIPVDSLEFSSISEINLYCSLIELSSSHISDIANRIIVIKAHPKTRNHKIVSTISNFICSKIGIKKTNILITQLPLELYFEENLDSVFIGGVSSTLVYAASSGKRAISFSKTIHSNAIFKRLHHKNHKLIESIMEKSGVHLLPNIN